jgi:hypothetical protein
LVVVNRFLGRVTELVNTTKPTLGEPSPEVGPNKPGPVFRTSGITRAQIRELLTKEVVPFGKRATIALLIRHAGLVLPFEALEAGTADVNWYAWTARQQSAGNTHSKPVLVASGQLVFRAPGMKLMRIHLTARGKRLLRGAKRARLTAKGTFTPPGSTAISVARAFVLGR